MKLNSFSITNFRSIIKAHDIPINDISILVGKNNEGKSNILTALSIAMKALTWWISSLPYRFGNGQYKRERDSYKWERDFPISLQNKKTKKKTDKETIFKLVFEFSDEEIVSLHKLFKCLWRDCISS